MRSPPTAIISGREAEPMMLFLRREAERLADTLCRKHASGRLDHFVKIRPAQFKAFVPDEFDPETAFQQLREKLFARHRVVTGIMIML